MLYYNSASNQINLLNDATTAWLSATLGAAATLQNSQCSLNVATATVAPSGNTLTLNLTVTFLPAFAGAKNIYLHAVDMSGANSGWQQLGAWTVTSTAGTPATVSVTPSSGSGASQTFALQYSDTAGASSLTQVWAYFNATLANPAASACMLDYNTANNQINLLNDNATAWMPATLGSATTLQNSQCSLNVATATVGRERQQPDAECDHHVQTGLCRGQERLPARRGCIGIQQRMAATGRLDCDVRRGHSRRRFR